MDSACVQYHPDDDSPSKLDNLGIANKTSLEAILEAIDDMIGGTNVKITKVDSDTVILTTSGLFSHTLKADVKLSAQAGNALEKKTDGLFVAPAAAPEEGLSVSPDAGNQVQTRANGIYVAAPAPLTAAQIVTLVQNDAGFKAMICAMMEECMGACPGIVDVTT
jgi:hypothetical protein